MATYDLSMTRNVVAGQPAVQQIIGDGDAGEIITGSEKLAQRYIVALMTEKGSIPYATSRGSNFVSILRMNGMLTEADVLTAFTGAQLDIGVQLKANEDDPADEQYQNAVIRGITITSEGIRLNFSIFTTSGAQIAVTLPLVFIFR